MVPGTFDKLEDSGINEKTIRRGLNRQAILLNIRRTVFQPFRLVLGISAMDVATRCGHGKVSYHLVRNNQVEHASRQIKLGRVLFKVLDTWLPTGLDPLLTFYRCRRQIHYVIIRALAVPGAFAEIQKFLNKRSRERSRAASDLKNLETGAWRVDNFRFQSRATKAGAIIQSSQHLVRKTKSMIHCWLDDVELP